jgi:GTP-binding protein
MAAHLARRPSPTMMPSSSLWRVHARCLARAGSGREARLLAPLGSVPGDEAVRAQHHRALSELGDEGVDAEVLADIERLQLGRRRGGSTKRAAERIRTHACGYSLAAMVLGHDDPLPQLPSDLPEVAVVGRSNAGKSALINALCGADAQRGSASVSPRAGHTASLNFFELREGPLAVDALMTLVDLPGYGPSVGRSKAMRLQWARATKRYLHGRQQLACAFVLVDASLGLTDDDEAFLDTLDALSVRYHAVLTKADLLRPRELAQSYELVRRRVSRRAGFAGGDLPMTSARNAAGVEELWERMRLGVVHRVHEMSDEEREELFDDGSGGRRGREAAPTEAVVIREDGAMSADGDPVATRVRRRTRSRRIRRDAGRVGSPL